MLFWFKTNLEITLKLGEAMILRKANLSKGKKAFWQSYWQDSSENI